MMNRPPVNELQKLVGCRYMLVTTVSKRARQLMADPEKLGDNKPVAMAIDELCEGDLKLGFPEEYEK